MAPDFQEVILRLHRFWAEQDCVLWNPYNVQVGAGTNNPATFLRVLGPEPWRVAYVEPSVRPDDGRYGENPNRMQTFFQYQVILKPDPGNPQELYLDSLRALGLKAEEQDIRFVEDNWESPPLGAWGLGWEVWLNGQEITQFTYFQQAGGLELEPVSVEITYGIERIVLALQNVDSVWDINWLGGLSYGDVFLQSEIEHCRYYFEIGDVEELHEVFNAWEREGARALAAGAIMPAYDYLLKQSHLFNVLDTRGAIGVTERATFFRRMREKARDVAQAWVSQREALGHPLRNERWAAPPPASLLPAVGQATTEAADFLLEIGVEELPAADVDQACAQLEAGAPGFFEELRLSHQGLTVDATPRRLVLHVRQLAAQQTALEQLVKGPPASRAFDAAGQPTRAALGFARSRGVAVEALQVAAMDGGEYVVAQTHTPGLPAAAVLSEALPTLIAGLRFGKTMRWNASGVAFSRPVRWLLALLGESVIPLRHADVVSDRVTRGARQYGSQQGEVSDVADYFRQLEEQGILLQRATRRERIRAQVDALAAEVGGRIPDDPDLLDEVCNLVEVPTALRGSFDEDFLRLPREVLVAVMRKHQRYFPLEDGAGQLLPWFIALRNGDGNGLANVVAGNEHVLRARFSDARFFFEDDLRKPLAQHLPRLATLTFHERLGSMLDKNRRVATLVPATGRLLKLDAAVIALAQEAAQLARADLATQMVVEMTSLQGTMGREYALRAGSAPRVADAIFEFWQPRSAGDALPASAAGALLALTDRLDSLVGLFAAGVLPRANADPYGLRRAALGLIRILCDRDLDISLDTLLTPVAAAQPLKVNDETRQALLDFLGARLHAWLQEQGFAAETLEAVLAQQASNPWRALNAVRQLEVWRARPDWPTILDSFARCVRITRGEPQRHCLQPALLREPQEQALYAALQKAQPAQLPCVEVDNFLGAFATLVPAVSAFFDEVLVNVEDEALRHNRLALLQAIGALQEGCVDLSRLSGF